MIKRFMPWLKACGLALVAAGVMAAAGCKRQAPPPAADQETGPLSVSAALSTNRIHIGDVVRLSVSVVHPREGQLQVPDIACGKAVVIRSQQTREEKASSGLSVKTVMDFDLTSFEVGFHALSTGEIRFAQADGQVLSRLFPYATLEVASSLAGDGATPRDIKGLARWPGAIPRWLYVLLLVALIAFVAALLVKRILSKPRTILNMPPPPPPHEIALQALKRLLAKGWIESRNIEPFYVELSSIVRRYIEDRFHLRAPERTTEEFIREAVSSQMLSPAHQDLTRNFLEQCDLVKFARHEPGQDDMRNASGAADRLIRETIPLVQPSQEAAR